MAKNAPKTKEEAAARKAQTAAQPKMIQVLVWNGKGYKKRMYRA